MTPEEEEAQELIVRWLDHPGAGGGFTPLGNRVLLDAFLEFAARARAAERERCARVADGRRLDETNANVVAACYGIAAAIREGREP